MKLTRRSFGVELLAAAGALSGAGKRFRLAICSETFATTDFREVCAAAVRTGYTGLEIDPSNLSEDPAAESPLQRREWRRIMADSGIEFAGVHSFLKAPKGLHLTTCEEGIRRRSWEYFARMIDFTADLGTPAKIILGSSKQRSTAGGCTVAEAKKHLQAGLAQLSRNAASRNVTILIEPLAPQFTDVVNTMAEAVDIVEAVASPGLASMFDSHNTVAERVPHDQLIAKYRSHIQHVHLNELDGRYPGSGDYPFAPVLRELRNGGYSGWLSVEVFDFKPDGETVARRSGEYVRKIEGGLL